MSAAQKYMFAFSVPDEKQAVSAILEEGENRYKFQKYQAEKSKYNERLKRAGLMPQATGDANDSEDDDGIDWHDFIVVQTIDWDID